MPAINHKVLDTALDIVTHLLTLKKGEQFNIIFKDKNNKKRRYIYQRIQ